MEKGIQDLKELAVLEVIYRDANSKQSPEDPDQGILYTRSTYTIHVAEVSMERVIIIRQPFGMSMKEEETLLQEQNLSPFLELTEGSQQLMVLEHEVSLIGNEWQNHPILIGPETLCTLGIDNSGVDISRTQKGIVGLLG
ncbi:hypothetical protein DUI87_18743 [Hirundo rustica rustica]|uniref:Uncharacterized protein n=1 Tax=Hirundo rustica rustica TaxID=333673 RepID=A0A3M0KEE3_HIRRU|nr:hypothetical protein DUI87_18743 [Hirundo rustica rustica]